MSWPPHPYAPPIHGSQFFANTVQGGQGYFYGRTPDGAPSAAVSSSGATTASQPPGTSPIVALVVAKNHEKLSMENALKGRNIPWTVRPEFTQFDVSEFKVGRACVLMACMRDQGKVKHFLLSE